ncbi:hypothetical protein N8450_00660 [Schleiferiaceae bacterium]|nr:hypothetical protein [Schleiferiaceae bacterium]
MISTCLTLSYTSAVFLPMGTNSIEIRLTYLYSVTLKIMKL